MRAGCKEIKYTIRQRRLEVAAINASSFELPMVQIMDAVKRPAWCRYSLRRREASFRAGILHPYAQRHIFCV